MKVLLVDDDAKLLSALARVLRRHFDVTTARDAVRALELLDKESFDALLTDYDMGEHNGVWLLEQVQHRHPRVRRLLASGSSKIVMDDGHVESGLVERLLPKPMQMKTLVEALQELPAPAIALGPIEHTQVSGARTRVVVADDHIMFRRMLARSIDAQTDMCVVAEACDGREAIEFACEQRPDVFLTDIEMPEGGGVCAIEEVRKRCPGVRSIALSMHESPNHVRAALTAGAVGYLTKQMDIGQLLTGVREVARGWSYVSIRVDDNDLRALFDDAVDLGTRKPTLSDREYEVLRLVALGYTSKEIAAQLGISPASVDSYRVRVSDKLGLKGRAELVRYALETGLLRPDRSE